MKQRVVGILVVGCLAIILVPLLLDGDGIKPPPLAATIPPPSRVDTAPIAEPTRPTITADSLPVPGQAATEPQAASETTAGKPATPAALTLPPVDDKEAAAVATKKPASTNQPDALEAAVATVMSKDKKPVADANNTPRSDTSGLPLTYVVRLGSFAERKNADALVKKLVDAGNKAYVRNVKTDKGLMSVVYVGPVLTKDDAAQLEQRLAAARMGKGVIEIFSNQPLQKD